MTSSAPVWPSRLTAPPADTTWQWTGLPLHTGRRGRGNKLVVFLLGALFGATVLLWAIARSMVTPEEGYDEVQLDPYQQKLAEEAW